MEKDIKKKSKIAEKAAELYTDNPDFSLKFLAESLNMKPSDLYKLFPNKKKVLQFYYTAQFYKYLEITSGIENFQNYTLAEKMSNLAYTLTDLLLEQREFAGQTFNKLICRYLDKTEFETKLEEEIRTYFMNDSGISTSASFILQPWFFNLIGKHYLWLVNYWLADESKGFENTMALTDKWTSFVQEMLYSSILDKGFDLAKFTFMQSGIKSWFSTDKTNHQT